jgi:methyl-accepting chemotaxis protein
MEEQSQSLLDQVAFFNNGEEVQQPVAVQRQSRASARQPRASSRQAAPTARQSNFSPAVAPAPKRVAKRPSTAVDQEWEEF